jgi:hypothetical protein
MTVRLSALVLSVIAFSAVACEVSTGDDSEDGDAKGGRSGSSDAGSGNDPSAGEAGSDSGSNTTGGRPSQQPDDEPAEAGSGGEPQQPDEPGEPDEEPDTDPPPSSSETARFFLPMTEPTNTSAPTIELDAKGGIHAVYARYVIGGAFYAYCAGSCETDEDMNVVEFETDGTVHNAMLALDKAGHPRVLLSTMSKVYYASCDSNCGVQSSWETSEILDHGGDREVTGEAFAVDPDGNPRFLMHTYRAYLGIGQKPRHTWYLACDGDCQDPASWNESQIADQTWEGTHLRYDARGVAHIATVANVEEEGVVTKKLGAYLECAEACETEDNWVGAGLYEAYEDEIEVVAMKPTVSMALTSDGKPRVVVLGKNAEGNRNIVYFECEEDCTQDNWLGSIISDHEKITTGLDLALDKAGRPRIAYTLDYNIALAYCDGGNCAGENASWDLTKVEFGSDMPPDEIFLWDNCTVGFWFLHNPSLAIDANGAPRVGYQARDISGGVSNPDPTRPDCVAGTDMTWSRISVMSSYKE